jgi:hypothetical protein
VQSLILKKFFASSPRVFTVQAVDELSNLEVFGEITKDIGQLGPIIPLTIAAYVLRQQERKFENEIRNTNELLSQQIKSSNDLLSKDIKATNELLSKDLKATNEALSKDISRLENLVEKLLESRRV